MTPSKRDALAGYARLAPVIPVVTIDDPESAVPLARTLVEAGLPVVEVTLRTAAALDAMRRIAREVPDAVIAAVEDAGARFIVTPGTSPAMADRLADCALPVMPACASVSEALALLERGFAILKFFPAGASGGPAWLKAVSAPVPEVRFCPTGGVDPKNAPDYLACPNVLCVGGSWMVPKDAVSARDWNRIGALAREAAALRPPA